MAERREGEPVDRRDTTNFRRRRCRTASVEGIKRCVGGSGCCATPLVSEDSIIHLSTGSPFGYHPRLRMVCPLWGQWIETVVSIITPTRKNLNFVVTLSRRSKHVDRQVLVGVTTKFLLSHRCHVVVTRSIRTFSVSYAQSVTT